MKWRNRFVSMAEMVSSWSKDPSTKVGCVLIDPKSNTVIATGYNGIPRGVEDTDVRLHSRPQKYRWVEHAERNAIYDAARRGVSTEGAWAFLNFCPVPCADCARAFIQAGIKRIVGPDRPFTGVGAGTEYHLTESGIMLAEAGVVQEVLPR